MPLRLRLLWLVTLLLPVSVAASAWADQDGRTFDFGRSPLRAGATPVPGDVRYTPERGFGFEAGAAVTQGPRGVSSATPFQFSVRLPSEGNYRVTVTFGDGRHESTTTVKAELRRLMVERVRTTAAAPFATASFIVNTRTPVIAARGGLAGGEVRLKAPRETIQEAWAWDDALTLEFAGVDPAVSAIEVAKVDDVPTMFLLGDSTVCDQSREPYSSWGQMLPRFFRPTVAIANHGESGETYRDSIGRRRLDKILSLLKPGDYVLLQFGHNDQKQITAGTGGPFTTYQDELTQHVEAIRAHGGVPVIVSPVERRAFDARGAVIPSLADYAAASRQSAETLRAPFIDLNAISVPFYQALESRGPEFSRRAFAGQDNTHHNNYGSYQLARAVADGLRRLALPVAAHLADGFGGFDPARPDDPDTFALPASPLVTAQRPLGDAPAATQAYVFTYFTKNGEDGLHLAWSADGYHWQKLNGGRSYLTPTVGTSKLMRDPCVVRGPDGTFHMVWTSGWNEATIGYASSRDLMNWTGQKAIPVMAHEPTVLNSWAPEVVYDAARGEFAIFWASTIPGRFPKTAGSSEEKYDHRIYGTTTKDFATFTPTALFYDPGFSVIDATFVDTGAGRRLIAKDETRYPPKKYLQIAPVSDVHGPFGALSAPFTPQGVWVEGPTAIRIGDDYLVYFDAYIEKRYGAMRSRDLSTWEDVSTKMTFPDEGTEVRMRHGTVIAVPAAIVDALRARRE